MPLPALAAVAIKVVPWIIGLIGGIYATKKITQSFGSTTLNDIRQIPEMGKITPKELYQEAKEHKKDRLKYHEKRSKKVQDEIDKLNEQIEKLQEEKTKVAQEIKNTEDPAEKAKLQKVLDQINKDLTGLNGKVNKKEAEKKEVEEKIDQMFERLGDIDKTTQEQFIANAKGIN
jgi:chromosome segregation ATPase